MKFAWALCALLAAASVTDAAVLLSTRRDKATEDVQELDACAEEAGAELRSAVAALEANATSAHVNSTKTNKSSAHAKTNKSSALGDQLFNLKAVYENLKKGIVRGNKREHEGAIEDVEKVKSLEKKIEANEKELNSSTLTDFKREMLTNETRMDRSELKFWKGHRDSSHTMFHAHLKMAHGMMDRVKDLVSTYEDVLAGKKVDLGKIQKLKAGLPSHSDFGSKKAAENKAKAIAKDNKTKLVLVHRSAPAPVATPTAPTAKGGKPAAPAPVKR